MPSCVMYVREIYIISAFSAWSRAGYASIRAVPRVLHVCCKRAHVGAGAISVELTHKLELLEFNDSAASISAGRTRCWTRISLNLAGIPVNDGVH
jgi:hypothetical protein